MHFIQALFTLLALETSVATAAALNPRQELTPAAASGLQGGDCSLATQICTFRANGNRQAKCNAAAPCKSEGSGCLGFTWSNEADCY